MTQIGRYRIVSELGRGAMGVVYRAHDPQIDREVALKTIQLAAHAEASEIEDMRDRLVRESRSAGRLSHPGIVTIYDAGEQDGLAYIAMELVDGRSLDDLMAESGGTYGGLEFVADLLEKAGSALDYASENGVVHRDVKPGNIMVSDSNIKLLDFGVARIATSQATRAGAVFGTPNYMSPEQVQGQQLDGRSDQFSLGVIAYEMLCGVRPFEGGAVAATMFKIAHDEPKPLREHLPALPEELELVVLRALRKSPEDRFESCEAFSRAFAEAAAGVAGLVRAPTTAPSVGSGETTVVADTLPQPDGQDAAEGSEPTALPAPPAEPEPRWGRLILVLLGISVAALVMLLVRYPGLLEDPGAMRDAILGTPPATPSEPSGAGGIAESPPIDPFGRAEGGIEDDADPAAGAQPDEPLAEGEAGGPLDAEQASASDGTDDALGEGEALTGPFVGPEPIRLGGSANFESPAEGVVVSLDGNQDWQCVTPCRLTGLPLGEIDVVARREGYLELRTTIDITGDVLTVSLPLEPAGAVLFVSSEPADARIIIDGRDTGLTTNAPVSVAPGQHVVRLELGELSSERSVEVADDETRSVSFRLGSE